MGISGALHPGFGLFGLLHAASAALPCGWGGHEPRGPEQQPFHVLHSIREELGLLCYTGSAWSVRRATLDDPDSTACLFGPSLEQPRMAGLLSRCLRAFTGLTISPDSSASPGLRLPGLLHCREGFRPLTVAATWPPPVRRLLPWSTCGHTQGLVRTLVLPSSTECNFMSQITISSPMAARYWLPNWQATTPGRHSVQLFVGRLECRGLP